MREFIEASLAGQKITVRILRKRDISENGHGISAKELNEPEFPPYFWKMKKRTIDYLVKTD
ncbi:MAG: hypothetical protein ABSB32_22950 [Thermodesulfobacteriota bacterium]